MIAAKYRLFSAEPKLVSSRDARTEEAAVLGISIWSPRDALSRDVIVGLNTLD
jgi:hypothetical protein